MFRELICVLIEGTMSYKNALRYIFNNDMLLNFLSSIKTKKFTGNNYPLLTTIENDNQTINDLLKKFKEECKNNKKSTMANQSKRSISSQHSSTQISKKSISGQTVQRKFQKKNLKDKNTKTNKSQ